MVKRVLVVGGYGNFGGVVSEALAGQPDIVLIVGGRSAEKAQLFATRLGAEGCAIDIAGDVESVLRTLEPDIVVHSVGPFQNQDYRVARACIAVGAHYCDLADARDFVAGIDVLDANAKAAGVQIVSGASSVPCLTAALIDHYRPHFTRLRSARYGISAAQQTNRGLATASAILSYVGRPFLALDRGRPARVYGWQGLHSVRYPELGRRWFGHCDIPDLALFPGRYPDLEHLDFSAGHELAPIHWGNWALSWLVRAGLVRDLESHADGLLRVAFLLDRFSTARSGLHMILAGEGHDGRARTARIFLVARSGHGPHIPCMPAIILAKRLATGRIDRPGASPCLDLIDLAEYKTALAGLDIDWFEDNNATL